MDRLGSRWSTGAMGRTLQIATTVAGLGTGLSAGVFLAFSTFVMKGLRALPPAQGLAAMQGINRAVPASPVFLVVLMGPLAVGVGVAIAGLRDLGHAYGPWLVIGAGLYAVTILVTVVYHVPRNDALDAVAADDLAAWVLYAPGWTAWNHVRTVAALGAAASFPVALVKGVELGAR
jgi:uncharacterized membrane protein